jgi:arylsulfatase A-like enzyme
MFPLHRSRLRASLLSAGLAILAVGIGAALAPKKSRHPNIILVVWDTCRGDRVSVNGYPRPTTPRLEAFAREGVTFRRCFTPIPWTAPAHASLFTGLRPRAHGLREGFGDHVALGLKLLPETLRDAGYETVCIAANPVISEVTGLTAGFQREFPCYRKEDQTVTADDALARVRQWLDLRRSAKGKPRPVFLFVNLMDTHLPYIFNSAAVAAVRGDRVVNGARRASESYGNREARAVLYGIEPADPSTLGDLDALYDGAVRQDDRVTGEMLDLLRGEGLLDGAFVAVCGDHGENLGEHGQLYHALSVYDPVLHVPMVVRWPGRLEGGRTEDGQVRLQDLYPTVLEAAGVAAPPPCGRDAESLAESPLRPRTAVSSFGPMSLSLPVVRTEFPTAPAELFDRIGWSYRSVRDPDSAPAARKYIRVARVEEGGGMSIVREELYDLAADPGETRNLLGPGESPRDRAAADRLRAEGEAGQ